MTTTEPAAGPESLGAVLPTTWKYSNNTAVAAPGDGALRVNNAKWDSATTLCISARGQDGVLYDTQLAGIRKGIRIQFRNGQVTQGVFETTGPPVAQTGWYSVPVHWVSGAAPPDKTLLTPVLVNPTWWTLTAAGDIAEWDVSAMYEVEVWIGGTFTSATVAWEVRRDGFDWTPVPVTSNRHPSTNYMGAAPLTAGTVIVGTVRAVVGAHRARVRLISIEGGTLNADLASRP
jgi:hypothetical protein